MKHLFHTFESSWGRFVWQQAEKPSFHDVVAEEAQENFDDTSKLEKRRYQRKIEKFVEKNAETDLSAALLDQLQIQMQDEDGDKKLEMRELKDYLEDLQVALDQYESFEQTGEVIEEAEWEKVKNFQALSELVMKADVDSIPFQNEKISQLIASTSGSDLLAESLDHPGLLSKLFLDVNGAERIVKFRGNYGALKYVGLGDLIPHTQEYVRVNGILGKRSINPRNGKVGYLNSAGRYLPVYGGEKIELLSDDQQFETPVQQTEFDQFKTATADFATLSLGEELEVKEDFQKSVKNNEKAEKKRIRKSGKLDAKTKKVLEEREARGEIEILKGQELLENREFSQKLDEICKNLGIQREHLVLVMQKESGINPQARNPNGGATGLIQFMPRTAEGLGTTVDALRIMSGVEQLEYVEKYYAAYAGKLNSVADLYMATFYPYALNKSDDYIIGSEKGADYVATVTEANKGILNRIGKGYKTEISKADFEEYVMA